jgi:crotonobetainyl-CoA:carnitine CoA-transferase CaiB-like acyl-CoA transferase
MARRATFAAIRRDQTGRCAYAKSYQSSAIYDVFEFANGEQMFVAATGEGQWNALCQLLGQTALLDDENLATNNDRVLQRPRPLAHLAEIFATMDAPSGA